MDCLFPEPPWVTCSRCGVQAVASPCWDCENAERLERARLARVRATIATIPELYASCRTEAEAERRGIDLGTWRGAERLIDVKKLVLRGPRSGAGKSTIAGWMLRRWAEQNPLRRGVWVSAHSLVGDRFDLDPLWESADLVVLDSLGDETLLKSSLVPKLLETRAAMATRGFWVTTALSIQEAAERYSESIARRVFDHAREYPIE